MYESIAILAVFTIAYSFVAGRVEKMAISGPIIFVAFGVLMGSSVLGVLDLEVEMESLRLLAELTLALVLFTDAANADLSVLRRGYGLPVRLLLIGLPLTIAAGFGASVALLGNLTMLEAAILATMLAPTDAALGQAVVQNERVPAKLREGLNVESGLNDGICVPILFTFLALQEGEDAAGGTLRVAAEFVAEEIGIGALVGIGLTLVAGRMVKVAMSRAWLADVWSQVPVVGLSVACFAVAQSLGGSGFIAAFCGGLLFGALNHEHKGRLLEAAEGTGSVFALLTWVVYGVAVVGQASNALSLQVIAYALLSLTLVRMVPVFVSVAGVGIDTSGKLFVGWFGPRGLASVVFGIIVIDAQLPGGETISAVVVATIVLSIVAHGVSANPLARWYGRAEA